MDATALAVAETYGDVEKMLYRMAWTAVEKWGGEFNEWLSEANLAYMNAYHKYDRSKGASFITWLWHVVYHTLHDRHLKNHKHQDATALDLFEVPNRTPPLISRVFSEVSDDARVVVMLLLDVSPRSARNPAKVRIFLWQQLKAIGWTVARVSESFDEIREVLLQ